MSPETSGLKVEIVQKHHKRFDIDFNLQIIKEAVSRSDSSLLVFPEMFLTGYSLGSAVTSLSLDTSSTVIGEIEDSCRENGKYVIFGFPERSSEIKGQIFNSAGVAGPEGLLGTYRKMHLVDFGPFEEWAYFTPGNELFMVDIKGFRIGVIICYDLFFPELTKTYALSGADAVVCISASPSVTRKFFERVMVARAIEDTVFILYSNLVGFDSRMNFWGGGALIGPTGSTISRGPNFKEGLISGEMDIHSLALARKNRPTLRDTRKDLLDKLRDIRGVSGP
ncbi:MAG: carbon-nitrogen hydrolase family protein [Candidatus Thermoplasmatota archaeon]|nr:carbon-nitrogen hydrolase family protein [Candidatus Thermoplasmatota archaeon]